MAKYKGYEEFKENRAVNGIGSGLYVKDETDGKYCLALLLETVPSVSGSYNSIDIDVTGSNVIGKILGKQSIEDKDTNFLLHRDNILRLMELADEQRDWLVITQDKMGFGFTGTITYRPDDLTSGDSAKGTLTITATSVDEEPILNALPLLKKTVKFINAIPNEVSITASGTKVIEVVLDTTGATCEITSDTSTITGTYADGKVTLTSTSASGSAVVKIKASASGQASWTTSVLVVVDESANVQS